MGELIKCVSALKEILTTTQKDWYFDIFFDLMKCRAYTIKWKFCINDFINGFVRSVKISIKAAYQCFALRLQRDIC